MKDLSELFTAYAKLLGFKESTVNKITFYILLVGFLITVFGFLYKLLKKAISYYWRRKINRDLHPFFTPLDVHNATRYYISTRFQNVSPTEDEEPGRNHIASAKNELMPLFLKSILTKNVGENKYYLILADSGMGKTTFLINLYIRYKNRIRTIFHRKPFSIYLVPIWHNDAYATIEKIEDPENSILLLDAFDESIDAQRDYFRTIKNLLLKISRFRVIVLTCRTQFFPSQSEEPYETGYFTAGERGEFKFQKLYLSVFSDRDVRRYINMRFSYLWQWTDNTKAKEIARKCPNLVIRPMLLAHIKELIEKDKKYEFSFQVYEEFINNWIRRESRKIGVKDRYGTEARFIKLLIRFSERFAVYLYLNREQRNGYFLPKDEKFQEGILTSDDLVEIDGNNILDERDGRSKSLLTRNSIGDFRFSHKSIMEYFLAKAFFNHKLNFAAFNFFGMDMVKKFHQEMLVHRLRQHDGHFFVGDQTTKKSLKQLEVNHIPFVTAIVLENFATLQPAQLSIFTKLETLTLIDYREMKNVYSLYDELRVFFIHVYNQIELRQIPNGGKEFWSQRFAELQKNGLSALKNHIQDFGLEKVNTLYDLLGLSRSENIDPSFITYKNNPQNIPADSWNYDGLRRGNELIQGIHSLKELLPYCEINF